MKMSSQSASGVFGLFFFTALISILSANSFAQTYPSFGYPSGGGFGYGTASPVCSTPPLLPVCNPAGNYQIPTTPVPGPGTQVQPPDANGRPTLAVSRNIPSDYDCPLFENRPYDGLTQAMDSLSMSMNTIPECEQDKSSVDAVASNTAILRDSALSLQSMLTATPSPVVTGPVATGPVVTTPTTYPSPGGTWGNPTAGSYNSNDPASISRTMNAAIQAAGNIGQVFASNNFLQSRCGKGVMGAGKALIALNDIFNNLAPFALATVAINPGIGVAAKFAITGGAIATSSAAGIIQMIQQGTVDMNNPDHRKALLKNTCQFTKIARKVRFLKLAQSGQLQQMDKELKADAFPKKTTDPSVAPVTSTFGNNLQSVLAQKESSDRSLGLLELQMKRDNFELAAVEQQMKEAQNDDALTCLYTIDLVKNSNRADVVAFPASIMATLGVAVNIMQIDDSQSPQLKALYLRNSLSRNRLLALEPKFAADATNPAATQTCANTARGWVVGLRESLTVTKQMVNEERNNIDAELAKNPTYTAWKAQYDVTQLTALNISRAASVLQQMAQDDSALDRSELDQRMEVLRQALFGSNGKFKLGHSPVQEWLLHTLALSDNRLSSLAENIRNLQKAALELTQTGRTNPNNPILILGPNQDQMSSTFLDTITPKVVKPGTRGFEVTCQTLETAWLDWSAAMDHIKATQFMCDMIDPYLDNKAERNIVSICRGDIAPDSHIVKKSQIQTALDRANSGQSVSYASFRSWAKTISNKLLDLKCPTPPVAVLN